MSHFTLVQHNIKPKNSKYLYSLEMDMTGVTHWHNYRLGPNGLAIAWNPATKPYLHDPGHGGLEALCLAAACYHLFCTRYQSLWYSYTSIVACFLLLFINFAWYKLLLCCDMFDTKPQILEHLAELKSPWNCPHGRPTMRHLVNLALIRENEDPEITSLWWTLVSCVISMSVFWCIEFDPTFFTLYSVQFC